MSQCTIDSLNDCYIIMNWQENIEGGYFPPTATIKNSRIENGIIEGDIFYQEIYENNPSSQGTLEVRFTEKDDNYYIASIEVTSLKNINQ